MKGVSPLLAGVLMIAFVLAVAAIVGGWLTSIAKTETSTIETGMTAQLNCSKGVLSIVDISDQTTIIVHNLGYIDLTGFSIACNGSITSDSTTLIKRGNITSLTGVGICNTTATEVRVQSVSCPEVWAERTM